MTTVTSLPAAPLPEFKQLRQRLYQQDQLSIRSENFMMNVIGFNRKSQHPASLGI
jgi:hypothetical protein